MCPFKALPGDKKVGRIFQIWKKNRREPPQEGNGDMKQINDENKQTKLKNLRLSGRRREE